MPVDRELPKWLKLILVKQLQEQIHRDSLLIPKLRLYRHSHIRHIAK
jgi:hypothetical protein